MRSTSLWVGLVILCASTSSGAVCGDCDRDGAVMINELITAVNYALAGTGSPTATPLPDRCSTSQPGQRVRLAGSEWVIVEVPVTLEGTSREFVLRYPVRVDEDGDISGVSPRRLERTCFPADFSCPYFLGAETSICGFQAATKADASLGSSNYYEYTSTSTKRFIWSTSTFVRAEATIVVDPEYDSLRISFDLTENQTTDVVDISQFGYSLLRANYPSSSTDTEAIRREMEQLIGYISLRPR